MGLDSWYACVQYSAQVLIQRKKFYAAHVGKDIEGTFSAHTFAFYPAHRIFSIPGCTFSAVQVTHYIV